MDSTLDGIVMLFKLVHPTNALFPIDVTFLVKFIVSSEVAEKNAASPIFVIFSDNVYSLCVPDQNAKVVPSTYSISHTFPFSIVTLKMS